MSPTSALGALALRFAPTGGVPAAGDGEALVALAAIDPAAAAGWLIQRESTAPLPIARRHLLRVLTSLAEAVASNPALVPPDVVVELLRRHGHLLAAPAVAELATAVRGVGVESALDEAVRAALDRAPDNAGLLRSAAELAVAAGDHSRAHDLLSRLGAADPRLATVQYTYAARSRLSPTSHPPARIALLSSFTIDPLVPFLDLECRAVRLEPRLQVAPFNTWEREMLGEGSALERFEPQIAFLAVAADDLLPELAGSTSAGLATAGAAAVDRLLAAAARFTTWSAATLVVHGLYAAFADPLGPAASRSGPGRGEIMAELNARLAQGLRALPRAYFLDLGDVLTRRRQGALDNPKMRHLASMRFGEQVLGDVARAYARFIAPLMGRTRKCVVLDLDNTLWGGIVGEDGPHGIRLGATSPGSEYREFQQYLHALTQRGILLAINSKNNEGDALEAIRGHEAMVLRESAFSAIRINWESKPNNLLAIAEELNLGLDAFVFVDDNEKERALMRQALPQVLTPEMPRDPARYRETLEDLAELHVLTVTEEDRTRTRQYAERRQREQLRITAQTLDDYLASLAIEADMTRASDATLPRVHQLFQRTNQFNLTGRRYDPGTLATRAADDTWRIYTSRVSDRFGDHGLVAAAVVRAAADEWTVENLVMSCRVIGYGVEDALLAHVGTDAREAGARRVRGAFIPSAKNAPARDFYSRNAFVREGDLDGAEQWCRELNGTALATPKWLSVRGAADGS